MYNIRYEIDTPVSRQVFIEEFTSKQAARDFLLKPPSGSKGFDYWNTGDYSNSNS